MSEAIEMPPLPDDSYMPALIPAGKYQAKYRRHETAYIFGKPKVFIHFAIHGGDYEGAKLYGAYPVTKLRGKPQKNGGIKLTHSKRLYRQFVCLSGQRERPDRVSLQRLRDCLLLISVRTVMKDAQQCELPKLLHYSTVDEMLSVVEGKI